MQKNEKTFDQNVEAAVAAAAGAVNYKSTYATFDEAVEAMKERSKFDPSLSQFVVGTILDFDPSKMKFGISNIGTNGASVVSVPAGSRGSDGKVNFNRAMNVYLSSLSKTIRVTDKQGDPVQEANGAQKVVDGADNEVWKACNACKSDAEVLNFLKGKTLEVVDIKREFGPANYVDVNGTRVPTGHRLTSLPLFKEI